MTKIALATVAAAAALLAAGATSATAAPQIAGPLYQETVAASCTGSTNCQATFTQIAPDMALKVERIDCRVTVPSTVGVYQVSLTSFTQNAIGGRSFVPVVATNSTGGTSYKSFVGTVDAASFFVGSKPLVNAYATSATKMDISCTIAGQRRHVTEW
jgi:hypothetical protein